MLLELLGIINDIKWQQVPLTTEIVSIANVEQLSSISNYLTASETPTAMQRFVPNRKDFNYSGRINWEDSQAPAFAFPGTAVEFKFTGTSLKLELAEDNWNRGNYVDVYLDDNPEPITIELQPSNGEPVVYDVADGLEDKVHRAKLIKRTDYITGEFGFHGVITDGQLLPPEPNSPRQIEVYGDSISAAATVEYEKTGVQDPEGENNHLSNAYYSYASMLAREYDAELSLVAQSGASLMDGFGYWHQATGAEAFYDKLAPLRNAAVWDFNNDNPDLVIIALGQNDSATVRIGREVSEESWKDHYKQFIADLRAKYPNAYFIGMFPNMYHDRAWDNYITEAIAEYRSEYNDDRVFSLIHEQVTPGHPRISEQRQMADTLKKFIDTTLVENGFNWDVSDRKK